MKYRVITTATVRRVYYVEAENEKAAADQSVWECPADEDDICEEIVSSRPMSTQPTSSEGA